jgi:hypothetical protein
MPLHINAPEIIRRNLEQIRDGQRTRLVLIGSLTAEQLAVLNAFRLGHGLEPMIDEVLFLGRHLCKSRSKDNYSIDDMLDQIASGMASTSIMRCSLKMSGMQNPQPRQDRYGNTVRDLVVFECSARHPRPELFSVAPKGDRIRPSK